MFFSIWFFTVRNTNILTNFRPSILFPSSLTLCKVTGELKSIPGYTPYCQFIAGDKKSYTHFDSHIEGQFRVTSSPDLHVLGLGEENESTQREPTQPQGEHANSTQRSHSTNNLRAHSSWVRAETVQGGGDMSL